ncbi:helix-turn-helix transcriptional regulator [Pseudoalteromonas luteoviolacea]|nr:helix-turn-helix transcriptional regulator [Pseudoalteromonas luteoviolacea]
MLFDANFYFMTNSLPPNFVGAQYKGQTVMGVRRFMAPFTYQDGLVNEARIIHVFKGQSSLICAGKILSIKAGDTLLMKADNFINRWLENTQSNDVEFVGVRLTQSLLQQLYDSGLPKGILNKPLTQCSGVFPAAILPTPQLYASYFSTLKEYISYPELYNDSLAALKIRELTELMLATDKSGAITELMSQLFVSNQSSIQQVVQAHLYTPLKSGELAFLCHMSESTFNRKFKQLYGTSVSKYFMKKRLEKAAQMIKVTELNLTAIALECGFEELSYFSRVFKQYYQCSPSQMRKLDN